MAIDAKMASHLQSFLSKHPVFSDLTSHELIELRKLFSLKKFSPQEIIVAEKSIVSEIFFVLKGEVEIRKNVTEDGQQVVRPIATLGEGESIGLGEKNLYSTTGFRTATVVAITEVEMAEIPLNLLHEFLVRFPHVNQVIKEHTAFFLRIKLIKELSPFQQLSEEKLHHLATNIKELNLPAKTVLFKQDEPGDACYLLEKGEVDITIQNAKGEIKSVAKLEPPIIFGESAILLEAPRNASATLLTDSKLLMIDKPLLLELLQQEKPSAEAFMLLQHMRSYPIKVQDIDVFHETKPDGTEITTLRNNELHKYFQLTPHGWFIWQLLDGFHSVKDITIEFYAQFDIFSFELVSQLILDLHHHGFIKLPHKLITDHAVPLPPVLRFFTALRRYMEGYVAFGHADHWITRTYKRFIWILFLPIVQIPMLILAFFGVMTFALNAHHAVELLSVSSQKWFLFFAALWSSSITFVLHELAHAYTTKFFHRRVHSFGIGWLWFAPFAFCDTSDMWLSDRKSRIIVDLAGLYLHFIIAGIAIFFLLITASTNWYLFFWLFALDSYLLVIANLNPAFELDGYYALMDVLDKPNLRSSAMLWLGDRLFNKAPNPDTWWMSVKKNRAEVIYWISTFTFMIVFEAIFPYFLFTYLLHGLFNIRNPLITLALILIVFTFSMLGVWGELRKFQTR